MRFIDKTGCKSAFEKGVDMDVHGYGMLSKKACEIAESKKLAVLKSRQGYYFIIRECGLGVGFGKGIGLDPDKCIFLNLREVDKFFKSL